MAIDKIFNDANVDGIADNIFGAVNNSVSEVKQMQQRKAAENVQMVVEAFKKIETNITEKFDNVTDVIEKRVLTIKDGRDGSSGSDGRNGRDGKPGRDGVNGKQGTPGTPGKDGTDGVDGVSVTDANIDFDGSLVISLSTGQQINVGEIVPPELERQLVELRQGGGSAGSSGDVAGPTSSTDNAIVRFDGTTGKVIQNSVVTIADTTGNMTGVGSLTVGTTLGVTGVSTLTAGAVIQGMTVGLGGGSVATNTGVGVSVLAVNTTGLQNVAVGSGVLASNLDGDENTGLGYRALYVNDIGDQNTAVGSEALTANTSGDDNTGVGYAALYSNTTGTSNTAVGRVALNANIAGTANSAFGQGALQRSITGIRNTALGDLALNNNSSGNGNLASGRQALNANLSTSNSTAVGFRSLLLSTGPVVTAGAFVIATSYTIVSVGTTNFVAIGASANTVGVSFVATGAGSGTGTASENIDAINTAIGYNSGSAITTGIKNTIIGAYTGNQGSLDIRTASNYVVLSDGDGNPRAYWNGASATFNGGLAIAGTLSATGNTSLATTPVLYSGDGGVSSGRLVGRYSYRDATPATPYFYDFTNSNTITSTDALAVSKFPTTINTAIANANALTAFGTSYGTKAAGLSFVSGTSSDVLLASVSSSPLLNADINAVIVGYTSNGPRIAIQDYALNDDTANAISYVGAVHRFYPAGTEVVNISSTGLAVTGTLSSTLGANFATSSGSVGVGTTSPSTYGKLAVASTAAAGANVAITKENSGTANQNGQVLYFNNSHAAATGRNANVVAGQIIWQFSQPSSGALQYAGEIAVLSDSQGGASTASSLNLYSSGGLGLTINSGGNTVIAGTLSGGTSGTGYSFSGSAPANSLALDSSGNLLVGTANVIQGGTVCSFFDGQTRNGIILQTSFTSGGTSFIRFVNSAGTAQGEISANSTTTVTYGTSSDYRLKTVIGPVADAGQRIDALQPVEYTWNSNGERNRGFLAHQFQEVYASSVSGTKDAVDAEGKPVYQSMQASTSEVIADLVVELQSLRARVAQLESKS